jgi:hypothetical protein
VPGIVPVSAARIKPRLMGQGGYRFSAPQAA